MITWPVKCVMKSVINSKIQRCHATHWLYVEQRVSWEIISTTCANSGYKNDRNICLRVMTWKLYSALLSPCVRWTWWRHQMETFFALLALCAEKSPVTGGFPSQRPVTRSFDVFFDLRLNKRLSKQSWGWCFETPSCSLWRHCNGWLVMLALVFACLSC